MKTEWSYDEYMDRVTSPSTLEPDPRPDAGTHRPGTLLPWPSQGWQRAALAGAMVLGVYIAAAGIDAAGEPGGFVAGLKATLAGLALVGMAVYAGWTTRWLNRTGQPLCRPKSPEGWP